MKPKRQEAIQPSLETFLDTHSVFTLEELDSFHSTYRTGNVNTRKASLAYYKKRGKVLSIRRGLYATVPKGFETHSFQVDPYLLASKLAGDAVLSHHTAIEVLGKAHSMTRKVTFLSTSKVEPLNFQGMVYHRVRVNPELTAQNKKDFGTTTINRKGAEIKITGFERTMVDVLSRPDLAGGWEEIWRSLETVEYFDLDLLYDYLSLLDNTTAFAKVGFYLEQHKEALMVDESFLKKLESYKPKSLHYMERKNRKNCTLLKRWNLLVPGELIHRSWGEVI
jgi:predicted transcriptional regulator of viral defense system